MRFFKTIAILLFTTAIFGCSSTEKVIKDGNVYTLKGNKILTNGVDVSETLSSEEKNAIQSILKERLAAEKAADELTEANEAKQKELERVQEKAEAKQKELEKQLKEREDKIEAKEDAREDFLKANEKLMDDTAKYQELHDAGKLSPRDEDKWAKKLQKLQENKDKAEKIYNNL